MTLLGKQGMSRCFTLTVRTGCWRERRWELGLALSAQYPRDVLQPCQGKVSSLAQILFGEALARCQVGRPVAVTALFSFLASGIVAALAHEGKGGDLV